MEISDSKAKTSKKQRFWKSKFLKGLGSLILKGLSILLEKWLNKTNTNQTK